jgi:hypothetical protein
MHAAVIPATTAQCCDQQALSICGGTNATATGEAETTGCVDEYAAGACMCSCAAQEQQAACLHSSERIKCQSTAGCPRARPAQHSSHRPRGLWATWISVLLMLQPENENPDSPTIGSGATNGVSLAGSLVGCRKGESMRKPLPWNTKDGGGLRSLRTAQTLKTSTHSTSGSPASAPRGCVVSAAACWDGVMHSISQQQQQ